MKSKHFLLVFLLQVVAISVQAARVDTVFVKSPSMNKDIKGGLYSSGQNYGRASSGLSGDIFIAWI